MSQYNRVLAVVMVLLIAVGCSLPSNGREQALDPTARPAPSATRSIPDTAGPAVSAEPDPSAPPTRSPAPAPSATAPVDPTASPPAVAAKLEPFALNLYRPGDFVAQYTFEWCVGASLQMMRNLTDAKVTRARSTQQRYWELARDHSFSPFGGANPRGWTAALNELRVGPYELVSIPDYDEALRVAARAIRDTNRPVGLVMWRGRHAWVMSGFTSKGDPRTDEGFTVTGIRVLDPLHPHGNARWGSSPKPNSLLTPARLARQFVIRDSTRVNLGVPPGYLLILPVAAADTG